MTPTPCDAARQAIETHGFGAWTGLPPECNAKALFGISFDDQWGMQKLGNTFQPARTHLLEFGGYYRPTAYVRDGHPIMFDGMPHPVDGSWGALAASLGTADAVYDWELSTFPIPKGEHVYASRGITVWVNPSRDLIVYVTVYAATTVDDYVKRLRPSRDKPLSRSPTP